MTYENIPQEMRNYSQWCIWRYEERQGDKPTKVPYSARTGRLASVTDSDTWSTFEEAKNAHRLSGYDGIGFILTENDPFAFIDLDDTKGNAAALEHQMKIYNEFDSYSERSPSGTGLHIIIKGAVPSGRKRAYVEVYSSRRYMTMTGDVFRDKPICDHNELVNGLWQQMATASSPNTIYAGMAEEIENDESIIESMTSAENGVKANDLFVGNWQEYYPSQSEADFALVNIIAFYTKNREQIARIFHASGLGKRDKAKRDDYLERMISKAFDREYASVPINIKNPFVKAEEETPTLKLSELLHRASIEPEIEFTTEYLTPLGDLTLLSANGGVGKTFLALIWLLCIAAGRMFMGLKVVQSPVLFVTAEDRAKECGKRLFVISADMHLSMQNQFTQETHNNFNLWEILGKTLWNEDKNHSAGVPTETMMELEKRISETGAHQVVIDNASSVFCANHNNNVQVTAFISYLRQMAERRQCNILILAHVSADNVTKNTSKTYYGSTAWHNAVRSRLFMELKPAQNGIDEHIEVIHEKSNYGKLAEPFKLQRNSENGVLRLLSKREITQAIDENISNIAEQVYLDIKTVYKKDGYVVVSAQGSTNFYSSLSNHFPNKYRDGDKKTKQEVKLAIQRLSDEGRIVKQSRITGNRNATTVWVPGLPITEAMP